MISDYDKKYNKVIKLDKSKWTSLEKINGYKHYEVISINKRKNKIELFPICEKERRITVFKEDLKNKRIWTRGWDSKIDNNCETSFNDQFIDGTITRNIAKTELR
tara:strand:+ start:13 stop:327 length:315 start_codon:yes stop_codon:yes gene_type:complete